MNDVMNSTNVSDLVREGLKDLQLHVKLLQGTTRDKDNRISYEKTARETVSLC